MDMAHAGIEAVIAEVAVKTNDVVIFKTNLTSDQYSIDGALLMFPDPDLISEILGLLDALTAQTPV